MSPGGRPDRVGAEVERPPLDLVPIDASTLPDLIGLDLPAEIAKGLDFPTSPMATAWALWIDRLELHRLAGIERLDLLRVGSQTVGFVGFHATPWSKEGRMAEIHYFIVEPWRGRGLGSRAVRALVDLAFGSLALDEMRAAVLPGNEPSLHLLVRLGFERVPDDDPQVIAEAAKDHPHRLMRLLRSSADSACSYQPESGSEGPRLD